MRNDTHSCETILSTRFLLSEPQRKFLIYYVIIIDGLANFVANSLVIATLVKTKQYRSPAMRIMLYLSISDVCISFTTPLTYIMLLTAFRDHQICWLENLGQFLNTFFGHVSALIIALLAFDRYARIKFLQEYKAKMCKKNINRCTISVIILSLFNASLVSFGTIFDTYKICFFTVYIIDGVVVFAMAMLNIMAMKALNQHCTEMNATRLEDIRINVVSLTKRILLTVFVFYTIYLALNLLHLFAYDKTNTIYRRNLLEFWLLFGILLGLTIQL